MVWPAKEFGVHSAEVTESPGGLICRGMLGRESEGAHRWEGCMWYRCCRLYNVFDVSVCYMGCVVCATCMHGMGV